MGNAGSLTDYYAKRAHEYERVYSKPERQGDLEKLRGLVATTLAEHDVLEIACGTGYWTQIAARTTKSVLATDINEEVLQIARVKDYFPGRVTFQTLDASHLDGSAENQFTAGLAAFWWSHLRKQEVRAFLDQFHRALSPRAQVVFMDNRFVAGSSTPISRTDDEGNTYQLRRLEDGSEYEVLKNFPTEEEAREIVGESASEICWVELQYYWFLTYRLK